MKLKGYKMEEVYKIMKAKGEKKGTFNNKIYLEYVDEEKRNTVALDSNYISYP